MLAEPADQRSLLALADLDSQVARLIHSARSLPQHKMIAELMETRQRVADELVAVTTEADDLEVAVRKAEADLVPVRARLEVDQARIADGSVSDPKVLRSLTEEVEHLKRRIRDLEDAELDLMGQAEEVVARRDATAAKKQEVEDRLRAEVAARDEAVAALSQQVKDLTATRAPMADRIPAQLLALYERLRTSSGLGAAMLMAGRCGGCQLQLTVADLDAYRRAPANEVLRCAECERILVRTAESGL